jgi:hypothetical protein
VNRPETEPRARKIKISKCSVSNQILGEGCIWPMKVIHGIISSRNISQNDLFMTQVMYMLFLEFWECQIQALPNSIWWIPNSWILFLISSSMFGKPIKFTHQSSNHFLSLILHLPISSLHDLQRKTMSFTDKLFQT